MLVVICCVLLAVLNVACCCVCALSAVFCWLMRVACCVLFGMCVCVLCVVCCGRRGSSLSVVVGCFGFFVVYWLVVVVNCLLCAVLTLAC